MELPLTTKNNYIDSSSPLAICNFSNLILEYLSFYFDNNYENLILFCIGTDRSTGDCLGPLIGYKLNSSISRYPNTYLLGTLEEPVHAKNLEKKIDYLNNNFSNPFVIAIDACLGKLDKIGYINIKNGPLKPGLGVNKKLPTIGNISVTGIVNVGGIMEYMVLQNTRLNLVMNMADIISKSINIALWEFFKLKNE
jgi:putative sporulation protein YyaC